jgi:hypothetical protein
MVSMSLEVNREQPRFSMKRQILNSPTHAPFLLLLFLTTIASGQERKPVHFSGLINDHSLLSVNVKGSPWEMHGQWSMYLHPDRETADLSALVATGLSAAYAAAFQVDPPPPPGLLAPISLATDWSGNCLQPINKSMDPGAAIVEEKCTGVAENVWILIDVGNGSFHLMNGLSGLCLDARGAATNRTPVQQWTCDQITNENWEFLAVAGAPYKAVLRSRVSGSSSYCLDVPGGNSAPGTAMQIYTCNNTTSQIWQVGPDKSTVVPNVAGRQDGWAVNQIYLFGLIPYLTKSTSSQCTSSNAGIVIEEWPQPGNVRPPKTGMTLIVCPPL